MVLYNMFIHFLIIHNLLMHVYNKSFVHCIISIVLPMAYVTNTRAKYYKNDCVRLLELTFYTLSCIAISNKVISSEHISKS